MTNSTNGTETRCSQGDKTAQSSYRSCNFHGIELFEESDRDWNLRIFKRINAASPEPCTRIHTLNPELLAHGLRSSEYLDILRSGSWNVVDGFWLSFSIWLKKGIFLRRRCGSDMIEDLLSACQSASQPIFILGGTPERLTAACHNIRKAYPGIICDGYSPAFGSSATLTDQDQVESRLRRIRPAVLAVCLGSPKGETWMHSNTSLLNCCGIKIAAGLGGTVDFLSGYIPRAPRWLRRLGLEWFFRAINEPYRFRRYWIALPALFKNE